MASHPRGTLIGSAANLLGSRAGQGALQRTHLGQQDHVRGVEICPSVAGIAKSLEHTRDKALHSACQKTPVF